MTVCLYLEGSCNLRGNLRKTCIRVEKHTSGAGMLAAIQLQQQRVASAYLGCPATLGLSLRSLRFLPAMPAEAAATLATSWSDKCMAYWCRI